MELSSNKRLGKQPSLRCILFIIMNLIFENWREFLDEEVSGDVLTKQLIEEGLLDIVRDRGTALKALKNKAYDRALKQFISISEKISDKSIPVKAAIKKYLPAAMQVAAISAVGLAVAAAGKPDLAQKIISGSVTVLDVMMAMSGTLGEQEEIEEGLASKIALGAALAGAGSPAMAQDTGRADTGEKIQQVDKTEDTSELVKNDDGSYSLTLDIPSHFQKLHPGIKRNVLGNWARAEFAKKMAGAEGGGTIDLNVSGRVSTMSPDTVTFTGNIVK